MKDLVTLGTVVIAGVLIPLGAMLTHIINCINTEAWLLLIAGAIAAPIGVINGIGIWFGVW